MKKTKALVVFSGGLDSILAARLLMEQGIEVTALTFESDFYDAKKARGSAKELGIELKVVDISKEMLELTKDPPNGYGKNMNPCIDCHGLMFRLASKIKTEEGFDILASGEVLGQRPFSQRKEALGKVMDLATTEVLRPLSAKLLAETAYENEGLVDRRKLQDIKGRSREGQEKLLQKYGIGYAPSAGGGCILTDPEFGKRYRKMLANWPDCDSNDIGLIKNGRVIWFTDENSRKVLLAVGRRHEENLALERLAQKGDFVVQLKELNGPIAIIRGKMENAADEVPVSVPNELSVAKEYRIANKEIVGQAALICAYYAVKARGREVEVAVTCKL